MNRRRRSASVPPVSASRAGGASARVVPLRSPQATRRGRRSPTRPLEPAGQVLLARILTPVAAFLPRLTLPTWVHAPKIRLFWTWLILLLSAIGLLSNLARLQITQAEVLQERAIAQQQIYLQRPLSRRPIVDRTGNAIALDRLMYSLYVHPRLFKADPTEIAAALSPWVNQSPADLLTAFTQQETGLLIERALTNTVADEILALRLDGVELVAREERVYPQADLFGSVVGYVDTEGQGQAGLELSYQDQIQQATAGQWLHQSGDGNLVSVQVPEHLIEQDDLQLALTLDSRLQRTIQAKLRQQLDAFQAKRGAVMVMDAETGGLLALVQEPTYDPNTYYDADVESFRSWVASDLYEPGSTFKPINVAIALEAGVIQPTDTIYDEGRIEIGGWPIENFDYSQRGGRGPLSIEEILTYSSNVAMVHIIEKMQPEDYYNWLTWAGFNRLMGTDLPSEVPAQLKDREQFVGARIEPATASFGQGLALTPLKLLQLHGALANGGKLVTPHIVAGLVDATGRQQWQPSYPPARPLFSPQTATTVLHMMEAVVREGTGKTAQLPGYRIAGKTGTAQKASAAGGYSNAKITSFVGILPVEKPRYVVLAVVDEPVGDNAFGSTVAAPIVKTAMESLIPLEGIPPYRPPSPSPSPSPAT